MPLHYRAWTRLVTELGGSFPEELFYESGGKPTADILRMLRDEFGLKIKDVEGAAKRKEAGEEGFEPTLVASTKNLGNRVEIRIRDNGTGIPPAVKEKMFNPFFTTKPAGEGTGLGLSMSHDIVVKQHGGTIDVDTKPGAFTEFIITLPRTLAAQTISGGGQAA